MRGIELLPRDLPHDFAAALARRSDRLGGFASRVEWYESVPSTNDVADRRAAAGAAHGTVVSAESQERGRGRLGRSWHSPPGAGLYVSVVLKPAEIFGGAELDSLSVASWITLTAGVALAEALRSATGLPAAIKWPNDLVVGARKVCGILAEASTLGGGPRHIVLGYGVNVLASSYPTEIADRATSIEAELGRSVDREEVFGESLACLAERLGQLSAGGFEAILDTWRTLSPTSRGSRVEISLSGERVEAVTGGIDRDGALLVNAGDTVRRVVAGDVRWLSDGSRR